MDFQRLFYINHEFENRTFDWVRLIFFLFGEFDLVRLGSIYYAGQMVNAIAYTGELRLEVGGWKNDELKGKNKENKGVLVFGS